MAAPHPAPAPPPARKKRSTFKTIIYIIICLIALSFLLQALGVGVVNKHEYDEMIERPHNE